jgi:hypothetical protein
MSVGESIYSPIERVQNTLGSEDFFEARFENDANGNPIYAGFTPTPNASTAQGIWFIKKIFYDSNQSVVRIQMPDDGVKFSYAWDDRASLFS